MFSRILYICVFLLVATLVMISIFLLQSLSIMGSELAAMSEKCLAFENEISGLQERLGEYQAQAVAHETPAPATDTSSPTSPPEAAADIPEDFDPADLFKNMLQSDQQDPEEAKADRRRSALQRDRMAEAGARMGVSMQYGDFLASLALPAETEAAVREVLERHAAAQGRLGMQRMSGDADVDGMTAAMEEAQTTLEQELSELLTQEELAEFEAYQEEMPARMMEQGIDMQLRMMGQGLTEESHATVKQVLVEEMMQAQPPTGTLPSSDVMRENLAAQQEAYDRALQRLSGELSEEQYQVAQRAIEQQRNMAEMMRSTLDDMADEEATPAP